MDFVDISPPSFNNRNLAFIDNITAEIGRKEIEKITRPNREEYERRKNDDEVK